VLAVSFRLVVLLTVFDEPTTSLRRFALFSREQIVQRFLARRVVQLFLESRVCLRAVVTFGVSLWTLLIWLAHGSLLR